MFKKLSKILIATTIAVTLLGTTAFAAIIDGGNSPTDYELSVTVAIVGNGTVNETGNANVDASSDSGENYYESVTFNAVPGGGSWYFDHWELGVVTHDSSTNPGDYAMTPASGSYYSSSLTVSMSGTDNEGTVPNPDGFVTLTAVFYQEGGEETYNVYTQPNIIGRGTTQIQDTLGGVINGPGASGEAFAMVEYGDSVVCIATAAPGHFFKRWIDGGGNLVSTSESVTVSDYANLIAVFDTDPIDEPDEVNVSTRPNFADRGTTSPTSTSVVVGSSVAISAVEAIGYDFIEWTTEGGTQVSTSPSFTYTANTAGSFIAVFEPEAEDVPEDPEIPEDVPEDIPEEPEIPEATPEMPETAGIPMAVASLFGGSLVALGTVLKKKRTK